MAMEVLETRFPVSMHSRSSCIAHPTPEKENITVVSKSKEIPVQNPLEPVEPVTVSLNYPIFIIRTAKVFLVLVFM